MVRVSVVRVKYGESKCSESKCSGSKCSGSKCTESKYSESKCTESKHSDTFEMRRALMIASTMSASPLVIPHEPFLANHSSALVRHVEGRSCHGDV